MLRIAPISFVLAAVLLAPATFAQQGVPANRLLALVGETSPVLDGPANVTSGYGFRPDPLTGKTAFHAGVDIAAALGATVRAPARAIVSFAGTRGSFGNVIELDFGNSTKIRFAHLSDIHVSAGDSVEPGAVVGAVGASGRASEVGLHLEYYVRGKAYDPLSVNRPVFSAAE